MQEEEKTKVEKKKPIKKEIKSNSAVKLGMMNSLPYFEPEHKLENITVPAIQDNRANHFANLAFILNPTYAERKNIDREIVLQKQQSVYRYVKRYADVAISEMKKYGIPASITLAQGILESGSGNGVLVKKSNNHFGIKCHTGWKGQRVYHDDDEKKSSVAYTTAKIPATPIMLFRISNLNNVEFSASASAR